MEHDKKNLPIPKLVPNCFETDISKIKLNLKIKYSFLFSFYMCGWILVFLFFNSGKIDGMGFGLVFLCMMLFLGYWLIKQCNESFKINPGDIYFKISDDGFEYTTINDISGKLNHHKIFWQDVIKSYDSADDCDVTFYFIGEKHKTKYLSFYISKDIGTEERILIPVNEIKKYKYNFHLMSALLYNMATKPLPKLSFSEDVFYYFNVNPVNFAYKRKSITRVLAKVIIGLLLSLETMVVIIGCLACSLYFNINIFYLLPVMFIGITIAILYSTLLVNKVPFLKQADGDYSILEYERDHDINNENLKTVGYQSHSN
ncbi:hypothetical protein [Pantoea allii]|uniref:hypothetical protein n=1 Tax=Pantoea allii TaxID=574096 RepID=UPI0024B7A812|nr:hypothetical protein [Pantoea allii]MDJ0091481.1 hypothetical protein [Pantoea allii]